MPVAGTYNATLSVPGGLEMTTSRDVLEALSSGAGPRACWSRWATAASAGQLEEEIGRNGWITVDASPDIIFDTPVEQRYERALAFAGHRPRMLSSDAGTHEACGRLRVVPPVLSCF